VRFQQGGERAPKSVEPVDQDCPKAADLRVDEEALTFRPVGQGHGAADAVIDVLVRDRQAVEIDVAAQEVELRLDRGALGLIFRRNPRIDCDRLIRRPRFS
jgi:hypothetical protein